MSAMSWIRMEGFELAEYDWFEVWTDDLQNPPYLLILTARKRLSSFDIYDPLERNITYTADSYQAAVDWLLEDEFTIVSGRMMMNEDDD